MAVLTVVTRPAGVRGLTEMDDRVLFKYRRFFWGLNHEAVELWRWQVRDFNLIPLRGRL